jgi:hypothetical protein
MLLAVLMLTPAAPAKILIDFGNNISYRCAATVNPDVNGNYWNSVYSGAYYSNLLNADGTASTIDFGFGSAPGVDSYNGPAGDTSGSGTPNTLYVNAVIDTNALGDIGIKTACFDYYVSSTFTIQDLDPAKRYNLTFFGSHKYNPAGNDTTVYYVCSSQDYNTATAVASASLLVGVNALHNSNRVATITNVAPQWANSVWIKFLGISGGNGYLNVMKIEELPSPVNAITNGGVTVNVNSYDLKGTNNSVLVGTMIFSNTTTGVRATQAAPGSPYGWSQTFSSLASGVNNITVIGTNIYGTRVTAATTITYTPPAVASNKVAVTAPGASVTNLISQAVTVTTESWSNHAAQIGYGPDNTGANWLWFPVSTSVGGIGYTGSKSFALPIGLHYIAARWINGGITNYGWDSAGQANAGTLAATLWVVVTNTPEMVRPTPWDLSVNDLDGITWGAGMSGNCSGGILGLDGFSHSATADTYSNVTFAMSTDGYQAPGFYCTVRRDSTGPRKIDLDYYDGSSWTYAAMTFELAAAGTWYTIGSSFNGSGAVGTQFRLVGYSATGSQLDLKDVQVTSPVPEPALAVLACLALLGLRRRCA